MKKTKLLAPLMAIVTVGATVSPLMTLVSCGDKGLVSESEKKFLSDINYICSINKNLVTCHKAVNLVKSLGYDVTGFKFQKEGVEFAYDSVNQCFVIMKGDDIIASKDNYVRPSINFYLWKFVTEYNKNSKYSQYLIDEWYTNNNTYELEINGGFDTGYNKNFQKITYKNNSNAAQVVTLRTYCDILSIDAPADTITHFEVANNVYAYNVSHYIETGKVAYLGMKNGKLSCRYVDEKDHCSVDTFSCLSGVVGGTQDSDANIYINIGEVQPTGITFKYNDFAIVKDVDTIAKLNAAIAANNHVVIRLTGDLLAYDTTDVQTLIEGTADNNKVVILDLDGCSITDIAGGATTIANDKIRIKVGAYATLNIIDSKRLDSDYDASINLYNHGLQVCGGANNEGRANLILNGASINYCNFIAEGKTKPSNLACVYVGEFVDKDVTTSYDSHCYVYGGSFNSYALGSGDQWGTAGLVARSNGAFIEMIYGNVSAPDYCICGHGYGAGANIDIVGGSFITDGLCIYNPQAGHTKIRGGYFQGGSCLLAKNGEIDISGGSFYALGAKKELKSGDQAPDGSVIMMDCHPSYGNDPTITVHDAIMLSANNDIFHAYINSKFPEMSGADAAMSFYGGRYMYGSNDYEVKNESTVTDWSKFLTIDQEAGVWIKLSV